MGVSFTKPERISDPQDLEDFYCNESVVDNWIKTHAKSAIKQNDAVVYASFCEKHVAGFYTLSSYSVDREKTLPGWLRRNAPDKIPAILLWILAVDAKYQGNGLGAMLLQDALIRCRKIASQIGTRILIVEPANEGVISFYTYFGFKTLPHSGYLVLKLA